MEFKQKSKSSISIRYVQQYLIQLNKNVKFIIKNQNYKKEDVSGITFPPLTLLDVTDGSRRIRSIELTLEALDEILR